MAVLHLQEKADFQSFNLNATASIANNSAAVPAVPFNTEYGGTVLILTHDMSQSLKRGRGV